MLEQTIAELSKNAGKQIPVDAIGAEIKANYQNVEGIGFAYQVSTNFKKMDRSEEHTSELQSLTNLVCRLLLEKKKKQKHTNDKVTL